MEEKEKINSNPNRKYYIKLQENKNDKRDAFLVEINNIYTACKYLMIICKKEEVAHLKKLIIKSNDDINFKYEFQLAEKGRIINEINSVTFMSIFEYEDINKYSFVESEKLVNFQNHFKELINRAKKEIAMKKNRNIILNVLVALFIIVFSVIAIFLYLNRDREIREEEDDILLSEVIIIRDNKLKIRNARIGKIFYNNNNIKYIGSFKDYKAEGKGKYYSKKYKNMIIYDGNFEKGFPHGNGTMNYYEGTKKIGYYKGHWKNSKRDGIGEMHYSDGDYYNGSFVKDKRNGIGEMHYNNHDYYKGSYIDDKKEGRGKYFYNDSDYYDGEFKDDKRHGNGKVYNSKNEIRCEGSFKFGEYQANIWEHVKGIFNSNSHCY